MGLVAGIALAYVWNAQDFVARTTMGPRDFQAGLIGGQQGITDIRVYPAQENAYFVKFKGYSGEGRQMVSVGPVVVYSSHGTPWRHGESAPNIRAYLDAVAAANPSFSYQYAWWRETKWLYIICTVGGVLLIGVIWPTLLSLMAKVGLAKARTVPAKSKSSSSGKSEPYDLDRFGKYEEPAITTPVAAVKDDGALDELNAAIERSIESAPTSAGDVAAAAPEAVAPAIRKLEGGRLQATDGALPADPQNKDFAGEFYPVARSNAPKEDTEDSQK